MAVKRTGQPGFAEALLSSKGGMGQLDRLHGLVDWSRFEALIGHLRDEAGAGRPGYPALVLFKAVLLQSLYGLSERELEDALDDRLSFRRFVGLSLEEPVPDHTVLNRFRNRLMGEGLLERLFAELDRQLEAAGVILKRGAMLDATLIEAVSARPGGKRAAKDADAAFTRRQGKGGSTYGYKAHVGVDQGSGLIRAVITTPANINDTTPADDLICGDEAAVYGDKAYYTHARHAQLKEARIKDRFMRRPNRYYPLKAGQKRFNNMVGRERAAVETTFATLKRRMGLARARYVGLAKVTGQVLLNAMAFNLRKVAVLTA
jgi:IS5 family transposase